MKKWFVTLISIDNSGEIETYPEVSGPFAKEAEANSCMQRLYDALCEELEEEGGIDEKDDSDAAHFQISSGDITWHFMLSKPEGAQF